MSDPSHVEVLKHGVAAWNAWRAANPGIVPDLAGTSWVREDLSGIDLSNANLQETALDGANLTGANLADALLNAATLMRTNLCRANLRAARLSMTRAFSANFTGVQAQAAHFDGALLWFADFTDAKCMGAVFRDAGLRATWLQRTDLSNADLTYASFVKTHMDGAILDNCQVYGTSIWDLQGAAARQNNLIITLEGEPTIAVDDLKIAQFIRLLLTHSEIRDVIETIGRKAVLILGRFSPERKAVLDATRAELRKHNYVPLMFDFDKPSDRSRIETVQTLAHLSRFVIADITDAKVLLQELQAIVPQLGSLPILPMMQAGAEVNPVIADFAGRSNFIADIFEYKDIEQIAGELDTCIIAPAEARKSELEAAQTAFAAKYNKVVAALGVVVVVFGMAVICRSALADPPPALEPQYQLETFVTQDDNVDRGPGAGINRSDQLYALHVSRNGSSLEAPHLQLAVNADGGAEIFGHYDRLDHLSGAVTARLDYRASGDFAAPTYGIFVRALGEGYRSDLRSKLGLAAGLQASDALTDRISGVASISGEQRHAQNAVFSGSDWSLKGHLEYAVSLADVLYVNGDYRRGDTTLSGLASFENPKTARGFIDVADDAFTAEQLRVYRMHAKTTVAAAGFNHALGANASLDLSWLDAVARPTAGTPFLSNIPTRYADTQWTLDFMRRF